MLEAHHSRYVLEFLGGHTAAVRGANDGADAGASYEVDGNAFFFEDFQDANMGQAAGKTAAQRESYSRCVSSHRA